MSTIAFCPNGAQSGILITQSELKEFSEKMGLASEVLTVIIPLPEIPFEQQKIRYKQDTDTPDGNSLHNEHGEQYWEVEGANQAGWCCSFCGAVLYEEWPMSKLQETARITRDVK